MLYEIARSCFFKLNPEAAHALVMKVVDPAAALHLFKLLGTENVHDPRKVMGLTFPNAVGLAAGLDKTGSHVSSLGSTGFGHIEVGTFTPRAQAGNPAPRCWRLIPAQGIVNHMGFNNPGAFMTGVEARSSSPVRIVRDAESLQATRVAGLYPCGEGAGYAGGIMSAAIDGIKVASAVIDTM